MHGSCEKVGVAVHEDFKNGKLQPLFGLGIDAGGTFTDAVVVNINGAQILAWAKAPTTPENPLYGLRKALREIPTQALQKAGFVSLATTFATNAIVEEKGGRAGLVLIGYDRDHPGLSKMSPVLFLGGGHDFWGEEVAALKLAPLEERLPSLVREVDAIAVSGYFSIRNPDHELRVARFIADRCDLPVVLGHQLSTRLDAPRRAATAWWNARLMPLIHLLIEDTRKILKEFGIDVPLLVVRGDGTLMSAKEAQERPVETILSGPAASILGARYLTGRRDGLVVDMGGTTSDMAILKNGRVQIDPAGARVGQWKTQVAAAHMRTTGLGGDSIVGTQDGTLNGLCVGPQRVAPLCRTALRFPEIPAVLKRLERLKTRIPLSLYNPCTFYLAKDGTSFGSEAVRAVFGHGPVNEYELLSNRACGTDRWEIRKLEQRGLITRTSLTPTDFCVAMKRCDLGSKEAAQAGVCLMAKAMGVAHAVLCRTLEKVVAGRLCTEAVKLCFGRDASALLALMDHWLPDENPDCKAENPMQISVRLNVPVLGAGAPAKVWLPPSFAHLHGDTILPEHFAVGTAVGAAVGAVGFSLSAEIRPTIAGGHILFAPDGKREFQNFADALRSGRSLLESMAAARMRANGVQQPQIAFCMQKRSVPVPGDELHLCTLLTVQATGRTAVDETQQ